MDVGLERAELPAETPDVNVGTDAPTLDPVEVHPLDRLEEVIVKVTTYAALGFLSVLLLMGVVTGESRHFLEALNPAVPMVMGVWMMRRKAPRVLGQLIPSAVTIALLTGLAGVGSRSGALLGILSMGIAGALMARRFAVQFIAAASVGLFGLAYWWNVGGWDSRERFSESVVPAMAFAFAAGLVTWLGRSLLAEGERRREAAEALAVSEEQFRTAFESSATLMSLVSLDEQRFLQVNEAACHLLGYEHEELIGMAISDVLHRDDGATTREWIREIISGEATQRNGSVRYLRGNGGTAHGALSLAVAADASGSPRHLVVQLVDMTEQHAAEQRLLDLVGSRDELIASVSHELRTPLTAVLGYASLLLEDASPDMPDTSKVMLQEIFNQGSDLVAIIEDLLVFAQSEADSVVIKAEDVDLRDQVTLVLESLKGETSLNHLEVKGGRLVACADPLRVRQVLRNLVTNAMRYGGESIVVEVIESVEGPAIVVRDNGPGIPAHDRERIFEPYQRSQAREGLTASIGVGLTVARRLARLMGGDLSYSRHDGWSCFHLTLLETSGLQCVAESA